MVQMIDQYGVSLGILLILFSTLLIPLFRKILKAFDNILIQKDVLLKVQNGVENISSILSTVNNCNKTQLNSLLQLYFSNVSAKLFNMILSMRQNSELKKNKDMLNTMISNNIEKIFQDLNIFAEDFKYNSKSVVIIINAMVNRQLLLNNVISLIENESISNNDIQCFVNNLFLSTLNSMNS